MSDTPPTLPPNQIAPAAEGDDVPEGYQPPLVAGGLFVDPNWSPRLSDRLGSVRTDMGGVPEHWPQDLVPVMYPHLPNGFWREVVVEPLSLASIDPGTGDVAGGTPLTLTGTGFVDIVAINWEIASYSPDQFTVVDSEHITCLSPPAPGAGQVDVEVVNANDDVGRLPSGFTYTAPPPPDPQITSLSPNTAVTGTSTIVTVNGANFDADAQVEVNGTAQATTYVSAIQLTTSYTPASVGTVQFSVRNVGTTAESNNMVFTVTTPPPAPTISTIVPTTGSTAGGDPLVISGGNFVAGMTATIDGVPVVNGQYINPMRFECTSPPGAAGAKDVTVMTTGGTATLSGGYTYTAPVTVTVGAVIPANGPEAGSTGVTIAGSGFIGVSGVMFGPNPATGIVPNTPSQFTCLTPAGTGVVDVSVTAAAGTGTLPGGYIYDADGVQVASEQSSDPGVQEVAQSIQESAQTIGEAAQDIGEAAQTLSEPSGTDGAPSTTSEAPSASEGTTEAPVTGQEPDMTEYEMDQLWGIEPAQGSTPAPASSS